MISVGHLMKLMDLWSRSDFYTVVVVELRMKLADGVDALRSTPLYSPRDLFK